MSVTRKLSIGVMLMLASCVAVAALNSAQRVKAFASLPDWSGLWDIEGATINAAGRADFANDAARDKAQSTYSLHLPYNAEWEKRYLAAVKRAAAAPDETQCDFGFPMLMMWSPVSMFQAIVTPGETTLIFAMREVRHIYTDGRGHVAPDELFSTHWGDSIGHWDGQTLVVDTIATNASLWQLPGGNPGRGMDLLPIAELLSDRAHFGERIRMLDSDTLEVQLTIEDSVALTKPWHFTQRFARVKSLSRMVVEECNGNERNPVVDGKFNVVVPGVAR